MQINRLEGKPALRFFQTVAIVSLVSFSLLAFAVHLHGDGPLTTADFDFPGNVLFGLIVCGAIFPSAALWIGMIAYVISVDRKTFWFGLFLTFCVNWVGGQIYFWFLYLPRMRKIHRQPLP